MKKILLLGVILFTPITTHAFEVLTTDIWCGTDFGSTQYNGVYEYIGEGGGKHQYSNGTTQLDFDGNQSDGYSLIKEGVINGYESLLGIDQPYTPVDANPPEGHIHQGYYTCEQPEPIYGVNNATSDLGTAFLGAGTILGVSLLSILIGVVSLLGLGFGLRYLYRSFFNYPGGFGYTPSLGSGMSRFQKSKHTIVRF